MTKTLEEKARKKRTDPVYSSTYEKDMEEYIKTMKTRLINPDGKCLDFTLSPDLKLTTVCCSDPVKYKNTFATFKFWVCKNCGADLGDAND